MIKSKIVKTLAVAFLSMGSLSAFSITGSESYSKEMDNITTFKKLYISAGDIEVHLTQGNKSKVRFEGDKEVVDQLEVGVAQGELEITTKRNKKKLSKTGTVKVYITTKNLTNITARGYVNITSDKNWKLPSLNFLLTGSGKVEMDLDTKLLSVQLSGSSELTVTGTAKSQNIAVTGSGKYLGDGLKSQKALVILSGSGSANVFVKDNLDVTIYGSGDVVYKGSPSIESAIYGSGNIEKKSIL
jgi:hypothetical protein